jgi:hypothetical protein
MIGHTGGPCAALSGLVMYCVAIITQGVALGSYVSRRWRSRVPEQLLKGHYATATRIFAHCVNARYQNKNSNVI